MSDALKKLFWNKTCCCITTFLVIIIASSLLGTSIRNVEHDEYAVVYNSITKQVDNSVRTEGKHILPVGSELFFFSRRFVTIEFDKEDGDQITCLSKNGLVIEMHITMQYQWQESQIIQIFRDWGNNEKAHNYLTLLARESFRVVCSKFRAEEFVPERALVEADMRTTLAQDFTRANAGATLGFVNLLNIQLPSSFDLSIGAVNVAAADREQAKQERAQVLTKSETRVSAAQRTALITANQAQADADAMTFSASTERSALLSKYRNLASSFATVINSTKLSADAFINSYLMSKVLREASGSPVVSFN